MISHLTLSSFVYIAGGVIVCIGCIRLMQWVFYRSLRANVIKEKRPYFLLIPPAVTLFIVSIIYDEGGRSVFRADSVGLQFRDDYGDVAYFLLGWPLIIAVLLSIVIAALYVFFKMPKDEFESEEVMGADKDVELLNENRSKFKEKVMNELQQIEDFNTLAGYIIKTKRLLKTKYQQEIFTALMSVKEQELKNEELERELELAIHKRKNVGKEKKLHDAELDYKIKELEKKTEKLKEVPKDPIEKYRKNMELEEKIEDINREMAAKRQIKDKIQSLLSEFKTKKGVLEEAEQLKKEISNNPYFSNEDKRILTHDIDKKVRKISYKL